MATHYVDPAATGNDDGTSWTDAWDTLQEAADAAAAGDTVYCRGTETLAAPVDFDTNSGSLAAGYIKFIGCNAGGTVDGTYFVLDGNSAAANCIRGVTTAQIYLWFENIEFKNATADGIAGIAGDDHWMFINCSFNTNGNSGFEYSNFDYLCLFGCIAHNNTDHGITNSLVNALVTKMAFCVARDNGDIGLRIRATSTTFGCVTHDNGSDAGDAGIYIAGGGCLIANCIIDGEYTGIYNFSGDDTALFMNRITNNTVGIDFTNELTLCGWNYLHDNTTDLANPAAWSDPGIHAAYITWKSTTNTNKADTDADDGYNARVSDDFNLKTSRTYNGDGNDTIDLGIGS